MQLSNQTLEPDQARVEHADLQSITLLRTHKNYIVAMVMLAVVVVGIRFIITDLHPASDTREYIETAQHLAGDAQAPIHGHRLLKPLGPIAVSFVAPLVGYDYEQALLILSIVFYLLLAVLIYLFAHLFLNDRWYAYSAGVLYITSYPILMYGLDLYTETGAWFFHLLGLYLAVKYFVSPSTRLVLYAAIVITLGVLWKEYAALAGIALIILILLANVSWQRKLAHMASAAVIALPILLGWQWYVYQTYDYTYLDWLRVGHGEPDATSEFSLFYVLKSLFALMLLGWLLVVGGIVQWKSLSKNKGVPLLVAGVTSLGFLAWGYVSSRLYFVLAPTLIVLAGNGVPLIKKRWVVWVVLSTIVGTNMLWLLLANNPSVRIWLASF